MKKVLFALVVMLAASLASAQTNANAPALTGSQCSPQVQVANKLTVLVTVGPTTWTGTLQAQGIDAQGNVYNVAVTPTTSTTMQTTMTINGAYQATVHGFNYFQVCGATIATGTANVTLGVAAN
jgi:hypothetical protein